MNLPQWMQDSRICLGKGLSKSTSFFFICYTFFRIYQYPPKHSFLVWYSLILVIVLRFGALSGSPQQPHSMSHSPEKKSYRNPFVRLYLSILNWVNGSGISRLFILIFSFVFVVGCIALATGYLATLQWPFKLVVTVDDNHFPELVVYLSFC